LRHQQIRTGVARVHCKEGSARHPIAAIIRHTASMPSFRSGGMRSAFPPTLAELNFMSARTMKRRGRRSNSERHPAPPARPNAPLASVSPSRPARPFYADFAGLSGMAFIRLIPKFSAAVKPQDIDQHGLAHGGA
jgi:hypothetical protein